MPAKVLKKQFAASVKTLRRRQERIRQELRQREQSSSSSSWKQPDQTWSAQDWQQPAQHWPVQDWKSSSSSWTADSSWSAAAPPPPPPPARPAQPDAKPACKVESEAKVEAEYVIELIAYGREPRAEFSFDTGVLDATVDCETLRNTEGDSEWATYACCGYNGRLMLEVVLNAEFKGVLKHCKEAVNALLQLGRPGVLGLRCRRGRHRSGAVMCMLAYLLEADGINVGWRFATTDPCGCPDDCVNIKQQIKRVKTTYAAAGLDAAAEWRADGNAALAVAGRLWKHLQ